MLNRTAGLEFFAHDEASIEDLIFSDITIDTRLHNGQWWGNGEPIHLSSVSRFEKEPPGLIKNVQFTNVVATGENGIILYAQKLKPMQNITFNNVRLHLKSGKETEAYGGNFDLRPVANPQLRLFEHDIPGVFARYVNNLSFDNFRLTWGDNLPGFYSNGIELEYCSRVDITNYWGRAAFKSDSLAALKITNTTGFTFVQTHIPEGYKQLIK